MYSVWELLLTPGANESPSVLREVDAAHSERKHIVPLIVHGTQPSDDLIFYLRAIQQIAWTDAGKTSAKLGKVFAPTDEADTGPETPNAGPGVPQGVVGSHSADPRTELLLRDLRKIDPKKQDNADTDKPIKRVLLGHLAPDGTDLLSTADEIAPIDCTVITLIDELIIQPLGSLRIWGGPGGVLRSKNRLR